MPDADCAELGVQVSATLSNPRKRTKKVILVIFIFFWNPQNDPGLGEGGHEIHSDKVESEGTEAARS